VVPAGSRIILLTRHRRSIAETMPSSGLRSTFRASPETHVTADRAVADDHYVALEKSETCRARKGVESLSPIGEVSGCTSATLSLTADTLELSTDGRVGQRCEKRCSASLGCLSSS